MQPLTTRSVNLVNLFACNVLCKLAHRLLIYGTSAMAAGGTE